MISLLAGLLLFDELPPLFTKDDYPFAALMRDEEGQVEVDVLATTDGRVGACTVILSSGSKALDDGTCAIMVKRARFKPATNNEGKPVEGHHRQKVSWELPQRPRPPEHLPRAPPSPE